MNIYIFPVAKSGSAIDQLKEHNYFGIFKTTGINSKRIFQQNTYSMHGLL